MKIVDEVIFVSEGDFESSEEFKKILAEVREAIKSVFWHEEDKFVINPVKKGNGVVPIKKNFVKHLESKGWEAEKSYSIINGMKPGPIDVMKDTNYGKFAVEWETGNVSSSHRALNKIALGIMQGHIIGGFLIIPVKELAQYLTDRIGNFEEIEPYIPLWQNSGILDGTMGVFTFIYDATSTDAPFIPKGKDGNAEKDKDLFSDQG